MIVLDINMPEMNGKEVLRKLQEIANTKDIRIVMYSSMSNILDVVDIAQLGSVAYFQKPLQVEKFISFIKKNAR